MEKNRNFVGLLYTDFAVSVVSILKFVFGESGREEESCV